MCEGCNGCNETPIGPTMRVLRRRWPLRLSPLCGKLRIAASETSDFACTVGMTGGRQPAAPEAQRIAGQQVRHPPRSIPLSILASSMPFSACPFLLPKKKSFELLATWFGTASISRRTTSFLWQSSSPSLLAAAVLLSLRGEEIVCRPPGLRSASTASAARAEAPSTSRRAFRVCTMNSSMTQSRSV